MAKRDYYDVLGVQRNASEQDLKSAFRKLAKDHHPDRNPDDKSAEQKFKEINEAYEVLKDPQKRAAYDRFGHAAFEGGMGGRGGGAGFGPDFASSMSDIFDDLFGEFMGGRRGGQQRRSGRERGADLRYNMEISLDDAFSGKTATGCVRDVRRRRQSPRQPGVLYDRADMPDVPGSRRNHCRPVLGVQRRGPRRQGTHAFGEYSGGRRGWNAHSPQRRGRSRSARRPGR